MVQVSHDPILAGKDVFLSGPPSAVFLHQFERFISERVKEATLSPSTSVLATTRGVIPRPNPANLHPSGSSLKK